MASRDPRWNAQSTTQDPRLKKNTDEGNKRLASRSPAGRGQPPQKITKLPAPNGDVSQANSHRSPNVDNATLPTRGSNHATSTNDVAMGASGAPSAVMGDGTSLEQYDVLRNLSHNPSFLELLQASIEINGKLSNARIGLEKAHEEVYKAQKEHDNMSRFFEGFPAMKETKKNALSLAQRKHQNANDILAKFKNESVYVDQLIAAAAAASPILNAILEKSNGGSNIARPVPNDNIALQSTAAQEQVQALQQSFEAFKEEMKVVSDKQNDTIATLRSQLDTCRTELQALYTEKGQEESRDANEAKVQVQKLNRLEQQVATAMQAQKGSTDHIVELKKSISDANRGVAAVRESLISVERKPDSGHFALRRVEELATTTVSGMDQVRKSLAEVSEKVTKLEAKRSEPVSATPNPHGLVQFTPIVAPENEPDELALPEVQKIWSYLNAISGSVESNTKRLDNLTTDAVVDQMVQVASQMFPDVKNFQQSFHLLSQGVQRLDARASQLEKGGSQADIVKLRADFDALHQRMGNLETQATGMVETAKEQFGDLRASIGRVEGGQEGLKEWVRQLQ